VLYFPELYSITLPLLSPGGEAIFHALKGVAISELNNPAYILGTGRRRHIFLLSLFLSSCPKGFVKTGNGYVRLLSGKGAGLLSSGQDCINCLHFQVEEHGLEFETGFSQTFLTKSFPYRPFILQFIQQTKISKIN
jgi:hypothetical protein